MLSLFQTVEHGRNSYIATGVAAKGQATYIKIWRAKIGQSWAPDIAVEGI